jgi:hypothetical protein
MSDSIQSNNSVILEIRLLHLLNRSCTNDIKKRLAESHPSAWSRSWRVSDLRPAPPRERD